MVYLVNQENPALRGAISSRVGTLDADWSRRSESAGERILTIRAKSIQAPVQNQPSDARQIRPAGGARQDSGTNKSAQLASPLKTRSVAVETLDYTDR